MKKTYTIAYQTASGESHFFTDIECDKMTVGEVWVKLYSSGEIVFCVPVSSIICIERKQTEVKKKSPHLVPIRGKNANI